MRYAHVLGALAFALAPGAAAAQAVSVEQMNLDALQEIDDDRTDIVWEGWTVAELEGTDVYNRAGDEIGEIEDVLAYAVPGEVFELQAFVVEIDEGPLGLQDREVVVPIGQIGVTPGPDPRLILAMDDQEMAALPVWDD